ITDTASAQAALPKLQEVTAQIDKVDGLVGQLSPEQRKALAGMVNPLMPSLNQLFDKVLAIPGVTELLKPTIDALRAKLALLTACLPPWPQQQTAGTVPAVDAAITAVERTKT